jgi:hypothetical protein
MILDIVAGAEGERGQQGVRDGHARHPLQRSAQDYRGTHRILPIYTINSRNYNIKSTV